MTQKVQRASILFQGREYRTRQAMKKLTPMMFDWRKCTGLSQDLAAIGFVFPEGDLKRMLNSGRRRIGSWSKEASLAVVAETLVR